METNEKKAYDKALRQIEKCFRTKDTVLNLSGFGIHEIPPEIFQLTELQVLNLSNNRISEIPESIGNLTSLQKLSLSGNQITEIPESIRNLTSLNYLLLYENQIKEIPREILIQVDNPKVIFDYYFRLRSGARPLNEAKLILVGRGEVGKSTLIERLVHNHFERGKKMTEGIEITYWDLKLRNENVRLNIWDFGGQEINHATHQFFLTERSLYLLVLDGRSNLEDADAEYWLKLINSWGKDSPVIVVLNKIKEFPFDINRAALQRDYPAIKAIIKTDCADATGIDDLRQTIERETDRLENLRDKFPATWFSIKEKLAKPDKDFLSFEEYRQICEELGENDEEAQERLAGYLHRLGIALNYKDDPRLQDTHILNPLWVTNGIYKILNSRKLKEQKGVIHLRDLNEIFKKGAYPPHMRRFLLDLMKKFELCFSFTDDECRYLIPELLDKNEPNETAEFVREECLNFEYYYPILTEGLLPRFIVRTHTLSEGLSRWRTGVVLQFEGCRALVKADVHDKKVLISIKGKTRDVRRRLLALIRYEFEAIHPHLEPKEMVPLPGYPHVVVPYSKLLVLEKTNRRVLEEVIGNEVLEFDVQELLNGIDLEGARVRDRMHGDKMDKKIQVFYSYSHKDEKLRDELETHLKILQRAGYIDSWHDRKILAGEEWKGQIDVNHERADIILLLISSDFIASDYCFDKEMKRALQRHEQGEARVIPIILRNVNWRIAPFDKLQPLPKDGLPITAWSDKDSAWRNVYEGLEKIIREIKDGDDESYNENLLISKVTLRNIRCFKELKLSFRSRTSINQFILFFGDNGVGKTTLLRSIALGLCDESTATGLMNTLLPETMLRKGCKKGSITIELVNSKTTKKWIIETTLTETNETQPKVTKNIPSDLPRERLLACGYGSARRGYGSADYEQFLLRDSLMTLFDYNVSLQNPELALRRIEAQNIGIASLTQKIDSVLMLELGSTQLATSGIRIKGPWGDFASIGGLGDGFQATLGWIADWFGWAYFFNPDVLKTELSGIILIDEIEQHLHPSWQREIIRLLHQQFPKVQFISTTHSPMCALGTTALPDSSVKIVNLSQDKDQVVAFENSIPKNQRADQVLTSSLFGLFSASGFDVSSDIERYSKLASQKTRNEQEEVELKDLEIRLQMVLGPYRNEMERRIDEVVRAALENELKDGLKSGKIDWKALDFQIRNQLQQKL